MANYDIILFFDVFVDIIFVIGDYSNLVIQFVFYSIVNGSFFYDDYSLDIYFEIKGFKYFGFGNFIIDVYDFDMYIDIVGLMVV